MHVPTLRLLPLAFFMLFACGSNPDPMVDPNPPPMVDPTPAYSAPVVRVAALSPGDKIRINIWEGPELSGDFLIGDDGRIQHPLYQQVDVTGVPLRTVQERVRAFLTRFEPDPQFIVQPLYRIFVEGEVAQPGVYEHGPGVTVTEVVALAGGTTEEARRDRVRVLREAGVVTVDITRPDLPQAQIPIRSGDQVIVDRRSGVTFGSFLRNVVTPLAGITTLVLTVINLTTQ